MLTYNCRFQVWTVDEWSVETKIIQNYYLFEVKTEAAKTPTSRTFLLKH